MVYSMVGNLWENI